MKTHRALIAVGMNGTRVVLATDSERITWETEEISDSAEDLGIPDGPAGAELYLFEGEPHTYLSGPDYHEETDWRGSTRAVTMEELPALLAMEAPMIECPECSKAGGADKPVYHFPPACLPETEADQ